MPEASNAAAAHFARRWGKAAVAGSGAHTIGESGNCRKLAATVFEIARAMAREKPWTGVMLAPLLATVPAAVPLNDLRELAFAPGWRECGVAGFDGVAELVFESGGAL